MNILFAYITPFHPNKGGIGRVTDSLTRELQRRGHNVHYLIYECGITVRHEFDYPAPLTYLPSKELLSADNLSFYHKYLIDNDIDIVINQSGNFSDSRLWVDTGSSHAKVVSVLHTPPKVAYNSLFQEICYLRNKTNIEKLKRIARILLYPKIKRQFWNDRVSQYKMLLPSTDIVCTLSENFYKEIDDIHPGYQTKYKAIPNPNTYASSIHIDISKKQNEILWVGLFSSQKRPDRLVRVWRRICGDYPEWTLVIVGYDKGSGWTEKLRSMSKGISNIRFEGYQDPAAYYKKAKIFALTSNYEGWGMVLTEAMQYGCVPIAYDSFGAASDIITDGKDGMLVAPFSIKRYTSKLRWLIDHPDRLEEMSEAATVSVKRFDVENVADKWECLFNELTQKTT